MAAQTICIIGGGLGGLGLAHAILRECPSNKVVVLERDASEFSRSQGIIIGVQQPVLFFFAQTKREMFRGLIAYVGWVALWLLLN